MGFQIVSEFPSADGQRTITRVSFGFRCKVETTPATSFTTTATSAPDAALGPSQRTKRS